MGGYGRASVILGFCGLLLLDPLVYRASRIKVVTGEARLKNGITTVRLDSHDKFKDGNSYWVGVTAIDSTSAQPESSRVFVIKQMAADRFVIRSVRNATDTCKIRWIAEGR